MFQQGNSPGIAGAIGEIGHQVSNAKGAIGSAVTVTSLTACAGLWFAGNTVTRVFGPEDVLPIVGGSVGLLCCAAPMAVGGAVWKGREFLQTGYAKVQNAVYSPTPPLPVVLELEREEEESSYTDTINDPIGMLADSLHLLVIGHSDSGKTSLVHAIAQQWVRDGRAVVIACDPDAVPGLWRGCYVRGAGDKWEEIDDILTKLHLEAIYRREERLTDPGCRFRPLYVVLSEYADIVNHCAAASKVVENILRRGRKLDIHLILDVQDSLVATLGFEGKNKLRTHFTYIVEMTKDTFTNQRYMSINQHGDPMTTRPRVIVPRLPDLYKLMQSLGSEDSGMVDRMGLTIPADTTPETGQNHALSGDSPDSAPFAPPRPQLHPRANGGQPGIIPDDPGMPPHAKTEESPPTPLEFRVNQLLTDERPSQLQGLTNGQVQAIIYCLLATGNKKNQTQTAVFGGKSGIRHKHVTRVQEFLATTVYA